MSAGFSKVGLQFGCITRHHGRLREVLLARAEVDENAVRSLSERGIVSCYSVRNDELVRRAELKKALAQNTTKDS